MKALFSLLFLASTLTVQALTIGGYNIRNFDYDQRYRISTNKAELQNMIQKLNVDVLSVEEINNTQEFEKFVANKLPGYGTELTRCGGEHGQHLGFVYNKNTVELLAFNEDLSISEPGTPGSCDSGSRPLAIALFQIKATKQKFYGFTVHLKSGNQAASLKKRNKQYKIIQDTMLEIKSKSGVVDFYVAGDFNTTDYLSRGADYTDLNKAVKNMGMIDLASNLKCSAYYWGGTDDGIETPSLLDHVLVTPGLVKVKGPTAKASAHCELVSCREVPIKQLGISYESVSDHCPLTATVQ